MPNPRTALACGAQHQPDGGAQQRELTSDGITPRILGVMLLTSLGTFVTLAGTYSLFF